MLTKLMNYSKGLVAIPVAIASHQQGLLDLLSTESVLDIDETAQKLQVTSGYLKNVLSIFQSVQWVEERQNEGYKLATGAAQLQNELMTSAELLQFPYAEYLFGGNASLSIDSWLNRYDRDRQTSGNGIADYLEGCLSLPIIRLMLDNAMLTREGVRYKLNLKGVSSKVRTELYRLFELIGWIGSDARSRGLTSEGMAEVEQIGVQPSSFFYQPKVDNLIELASKEEAVWDWTGSDPIATVRRNLRDWEEASCRKLYLPYWKSIIQTLFDRSPIEDRPNRIAEVDNGRDSFLYKADNSVRDYEWGEQLQFREDALLIRPWSGDLKSWSAHVHLLGTILYDPALNKMGTETLMRAAEAGLFPNSALLSNLPERRGGAPFYHFVKNEYCIRLAKPTDLPTLHRLEKLCWDDELQVSKETLARRIRRYPAGQLVLEVEGAVVGSIYSQRIHNKDELTGKTSAAVESLHDDKGQIVQLLSINVLPEVQNQGLGDRLLEFMLLRSEAAADIHSVIGVTRCRDFKRSGNSSMERYITENDARGLPLDPILRFHFLHGASIRQLMPGYRPKDKRNDGYGVLVEYALDSRKSGEPVIQPLQEERSFAGTSLEAYVITAVASAIGSQGEDIDPNRPLMELGLDSADLLSLNEQFSHTFGLDLEASFFFKYNTAFKIANYLMEHAKQTGQKRAGEWEASFESKDLSVGKGIAVIGYAFRLPGGITNEEELWEMLQLEKHGITALPNERWSWPSYIDPQSEHRGIDRGGFISGLDQFDPSFFRIPKQAAEWMDPQQRLLLELSWECIEHAGYAAKDLSGSRTGVYIGASGSDYQLLLNQDRSSEIDAGYGVSCMMSILANRLSFFYDFHGPSLHIDTACSSSLVAVHEATAALERGDCEQALVGGIHLMCHPANTISYYKAGMLSKDSVCRPFSQEANGYVRGEGAVILMLKPIHKALKDRDAILGIIRGSAINHGGQAGGLTVPNPGSQAELIREAQRSAGVRPEMIGYIEAHGTGTQLGDPIEIAGLKEAFALSNGDSPRRKHCGIGSIKSNIGHLEAAAGITGLLKALTCIRRKAIPPTIHCRQISKHIRLEDTPFYIAQEMKGWELEEGQKTRIAGVSSFGSGGTNAHVIIEEYQDTLHRRGVPQPGYLIVLSAKTPKALRQKETDFLNWLNRPGVNPDLLALSTVCMTGREHFKERVAIVTRSVDELRSQLERLLRTGTSERVLAGTVNPRTSNREERLGESVASVIAEAKRRGSWHSEEQCLTTLRKLAEYYVNEMTVEWNLLFDDIDWRYLKVPTYPFQNERYWIPDTGSQGIAEARVTSGITPFLHPLVHHNVSNMREQQFRSDFGGGEYYLRDHVVNGMNVLPGVAYLEMAMAAWRLSLPDEGDGQEVCSIRDVDWIRPYSGLIPIYTRLYPVKESLLAFEMYSKSDSGEITIHCQGQATGRKASPPVAIEVNEIRAQLKGERLTAETCYDRLERSGLIYRQSFRGIRSVMLNDEEALAELAALHEAVTEDRYHVPLGLIDAALQTALILHFRHAQGDFPLMLPFALEEIEYISGCDSNLLAWVRYRNEGNRTGDQAIFDIDLLDEEGQSGCEITGIDDSSKRGRANRQAK